MAALRFLGLVFVILLVGLVQFPGIVHAPVPVVTVASNASVGTSSMGTLGGQKLFEDSTGRLIAVYVDSSGRIAVSFANGDPIVDGWSTPVKSLSPTAEYARPAAVLASLSSLRIIAEGGTGTGHVNDLQVSIQRDSQSNIIGVSYGTITVLDGSGLGRNPTAILAHNGDVLVGWNWLNTQDSSRVKTARWSAGVGWTGFTGSVLPDDAVVDTSNRVTIYPSIVERGDNHHVYLIGSRSNSSPSSTLIFNKAVFDGSNWSWGAQSLNFETNAARGLEDSPSLAWDPVRSQVVASYDIAGNDRYGVFTLDSSDNKAHLDTVELAVAESGWGNIAVDASTGVYFLFLIDAPADGEGGRIGYTRFAGGSWNATLTVIDSEMNNIGLSIRRAGSATSFDLVYAKGTTSTASIRFFRIGSVPLPLSHSFTISPASPSIGQPVTFAASAEGGAPPYTFTWDFGDGSTATGPTVSHAYSPDGTYTVRLVTTDNASSTLTSQRSILVGIFSFAAAGDFGLNSRSGANWRSMASSGANFALALGDLLYNDPPPTEEDWCRNFKGNITNVELIVGNHETLESNVTQGGGSITKFLVHCPFTLGSLTGSYGFQYYFDYPSNNPLARFVMVMPGIWNGTSGSSRVSYGNGTVTQRWVGDTIDSARAGGIPWIVVGMHKMCIAATAHSCEIGQDFMRFLISKKVDLVLQAHDHNYQRSKQLTCATEGVYVPSCVANDGSTGSYTKGAGTVFLIDGTGGDSIYGIEPSDPELPYFAATNDISFGYTLYTVSTSVLRGQFVPTTGVFTDSWAISPPGPDFGIAASPLSLTVAPGSTGTSTITVSSRGGFNGTVSLSTTVSPAGITASINPSSVTLESGGSATSTLAITTSSTSVGSYNFIVNGTSGSLSHLVTVSVSVEADFSITANPASLSIVQGTSAITTITVTSLGGFTATVGMSASVSPSGLRTQVNPIHVFVSPGEQGLSTLKVSVPRRAVVGNYTVTVTGTSGSLSHSVSIIVTVTSRAAATALLEDSLFPLVADEVLLLGEVSRFEELSFIDFKQSRRVEGYNPTTATSIRGGVEGGGGLSLTPHMWQKLASGPTDTPHSEQ